MRLIDADKFLHDEMDAYLNTKKIINDGLLAYVNRCVHEKVRMLIKDAPTVELTDSSKSVDRRGRWECEYAIRDTGEKTTYHRCSYCYGFSTRLYGQMEYRYCPVCGAEMNLEEQE